MASSSLHLIFLSSLTIFFFHFSQFSAKQLEIQPMGSTGIHISIHKNANPPQYYAAMEISDKLFNLVIDLGGRLTWLNCENYNSTTYRQIRCGSRKCQAANIGTGCIFCAGSPHKPGCTYTTCSASPYNPFTHFYYGGGLGEDVAEVDSTDGLSTIASNKVPDFPFLCTTSALLEGLASGTNGILGLGRSQTSLQATITKTFKLPHPNKFAICIPSSTETGYGSIFIGGGPYYMLPYTKDLSKSLATTPLVINPVGNDPFYIQGDASNEYFIDVKFIRVNGVRLSSLNASLLAIDKQGNGGTKLSTAAPHMVLQSSIYKSVVNKFVKMAASKKIKRMASVSPFGACFDSKTIGTSKTGPDVPIIDLVFQNGVYWRIYGANSMVRVSNGTVLCLGFVDGGAEPTTSVVLGGHQLENYLLEFDLGSSVLGFSSSLLVHNTTCSHYRIF